MTAASGLTERIALLELGYYMQGLDREEGAPTLAAYLGDALLDESAYLRSQLATLATEMKLRGVSYWEVVRRLDALSTSPAVLGLRKIEPEPKEQQ